MTKKELEVQLAALKEEYRLASNGLIIGTILTLGVMASMVLTKFAPLVKEGLLSGTHLVLMVLICAFAVVIYFSFVFGRAAKLRAKITEKEKLLEMSSGDKVR